MGGRPVPPGSVPASEAAGIAVLHQESTVVPDLNAIDNLFVGREPTRLRGLSLDRRRMHKEAAAVFRRLEQDFDLEVPVGELPLADRQTVAMGRALSQECRLLVMDEPTASLSARETEALLALVRRLRGEGVTILYVSHRLEEVFAIADRVTVLRDGRHVATCEVGHTTKADLIRLMVGREVEELTKRHDHAGDTGGVRLSVNRLRGNGFRDGSLNLRGGEIVGLAGLVGAGRSEVARAVFGIDAYDSGEVFLDGKLLPPGSVQAAVCRAEEILVVLVALGGVEREVAADAEVEGVPAEVGLCGHLRLEVEDEVALLVLVGGEHIVVVHPEHPQGGEDEELARPDPDRVIGADVGSDLLAERGAGGAQARDESRGD